MTQDLLIQHVDVIKNVAIKCVTAVSTHHLIDQLQQLYSVSLNVLLDVFNTFSQGY